MKTLYPPFTAVRSVGGDNKALLLLPLLNTFLWMELCRRQQG